MRRTLACIIGMMCICCAAFAQYPTVTATVTTTADAVVYNYHLINTSDYTISQFGLTLPDKAGPIQSSSMTTTMTGWVPQYRICTGFQTLYWFDSTQEPSGQRIAPGDSADFSFTTRLGVPTVYDYAAPGFNGSNWYWGGEGNTILPVPGPVPEPSSFAGLAFGVLPLGVMMRRKRK